MANQGKRRGMHQKKGGLGNAEEEYEKDETACDETTQEKVDAEIA